MEPLSAEAQTILVVVCAHAQATAPDGVAAHGHNSWTPYFYDPLGPSVTCAVCQARLPLDA